MDKKRNKYWEGKDVKKFANYRLDSRIYLLHKRIGEITRELDAGNILDYGAGEAYLADFLDNNCEYYYFDINPVFYDIAKKNLLNSKNNHYFLHKKEDIENNKFDVIVLSLVILTIFDEETIIGILKTMHDKLKDDGLILIADTHPCFRDRVFSTFHTEFSLGKSFDYFRNERFNVYLRNSNEESFINIYDFHYKISDYIKFAKKSNFYVSDIEELSDLTIDNNYFNKTYPPYIIFKFKKI